MTTYVTEKSQILIWASANPKMQGDNNGGSTLFSVLYVTVKYLPLYLLVKLDLTFLSDSCEANFTA